MISYANLGIVEEKVESIVKATNNEAEYRALIAALERATRYCKDDVEHYSDSELLVRQLRRQYFESDEGAENAPKVEF